MHSHLRPWYATRLTVEPCNLTQHTWLARARGPRRQDSSSSSLVNMLSKISRNTIQCMPLDQQGQLTFESLSINRNSDSVSGNRHERKYFHASSSILEDVGLRIFNRNPHMVTASNDSNQQGLSVINGHTPRPCHESHARKAPHQDRQRYRIMTFVPTSLPALTGPSHFSVLCQRQVQLVSRRSNPVRLRIIVPKCHRNL